MKTHRDNQDSYLQGRWEGRACVYAQTQRGVEVGRDANEH